MLRWILMMMGKADGRRGEFTVMANLRELYSSYHTLWIIMVGDWRAHPIPYVFDAGLWGEEEAERQAKERFDELAQAWSCILFKSEYRADLDNTPQNKKGYPHG